MPDNYRISSSFVRIPEPKLEQAEQIMDRVLSEIDETDRDDNNLEWFSIDRYTSKTGHKVGHTNDPNETGLWIYSDEYFNATCAEKLIKCLVEELDLPGMHMVSWAYTCSKLNIGEFGGGAFCVQKGKDTVWIDAAHSALAQAAMNHNTEKHTATERDGGNYR